MITDSIIDAVNAKYFCIFKDPEFKAKLKEVLSAKNEKTGKKLMTKAVSDSIDGNKQLNEFVQFAPIAAAAGPALETAAAVIAGLGVAWFGSKCVQTASKGLSSNLTAQSKPNGYAKASDTSGLAPSYGSDSMSYAGDLGLQKFVPQKNFTQSVAQIVDKVADVASSGSSKDDDKKGKTPWWRSLLAWFGGLATGFLSWLASFLAGLGITVTTEALAGIITGVVALASYLVPRVKQWIRRAMKRHVVAETLFTTSNGDDVNAYFSYDDFKWHVEYAGARLISKPNMELDDKQDLMKTKFFKRFNNECKKTLHGIFDDAEHLTACASIALMMEDDDIVDEYKKILSLKDKILEGIDNPVIS